MRIFSTGRDPIGPRFSLSKNSSSKLFLIRTIILREELGRFEPILHCPDWGEVFSYSYSHSTMRHGQLTISNLNGEMMRKVLLTYTKATRNYHCPRDDIANNPVYLLLTVCLKRAGGRMHARRGYTVWCPHNHGDQAGCPHFACQHRFFFCRYHV